MLMWAVAPSMRACDYPRTDDKEVWTSAGVVDGP